MLIRLIEIVPLTETWIQLHKDGICVNVAVAVGHG